MGFVLFAGKVPLLAFDGGGFLRIGLERMATGFAAWAGLPEIGHASTPRLVEARMTAMVFSSALIFKASSMASAASISTLLMNPESSNGPLLMKNPSTDGSMRSLMAFSLGYALTYTAIIDTSIHFSQPPISGRGRG